ncbi:LysR family transcriptional regulator [Spongisporangium articulatum]|uniref:LysR family transcriptional regulator n=1 Tax=Spongisporangium articulatum TaxID=3362603 RepID=A0ABW8AT35_9ACTN
MPGPALTHVPDLDSLDLLLRVAATGSLGQAAAAHGISQPAVSARIRSMERQVGFALVHRGPTGSTLTPGGALVADWARDVLHAAAELEAGILSLRDEREGRLVVAASQTVAEHLLPRWLVRLSVERPQTAVQLAAMNSAGVVKAVLAGDAGLGFVEGPGVPRGLGSRIVTRDRLTVVVPPGHPWARRRTPVGVEELAATRLVHREPASGTRAAFEAALERALPGHPPLPDPLLEVSTGSAVRSAVAAGAGPAVLSDLAVRDDVGSGRLVEVAVRGVDLGRDLRAVWPTAQRPTGPAQDLLAIATARA